MDQSVSGGHLRRSAERLEGCQGGASVALASVVLLDISRPMPARPANATDWQLPAAPARTQFSHRLAGSRSRGAGEPQSSVTIVASRRQLLTNSGAGTPRSAGQKNLLPAGPLRG